MIFILSLYLIFISSSLSTKITSHILIIAPPLLSHIIPSLELAKQLSTHCHVTYLTSTNKIHELQQKDFIPIFNSSNTLDIVGLNDGNNQSTKFPVQDSQINLNNITEAILNDDQRSIFNTIFDRMGSTLNQLFHSNLNIYSSSISYSSLKLLSDQSLTTHPISRPINMIIGRAMIPLPSSNLSIPFYLFLPSNLRGVVKYLNFDKTNMNRPKAFINNLRNNIYHANGFICNSLKEFDEKYLDEFSQLSGKQVPIHFIAPIIFNNHKFNENKDNEIINWLDKQPVNSVIYIAFGSLVHLPSSAINMIAKALSPYSFIWSLKTKVSLSQLLMNIDSDHQLILEWTPQRAILSHSSISFFFSHGGWNSLLEGMFYGKSILVWPFFADQFDNAQQIIDMGIGRQVSNNLQIDIEQMLKNNNYSNQVKQIQELLVKAQKNSSKEQIRNIIQFIVNKEEHDEL